MAIEIRDVHPEERADWNDALDTTFMRPRRDQANDAAYWDRHPDAPGVVSHQRGAFAEGRLVGTALSFDTALSAPGGGDLMVDALSGVAVVSTHRRRGVLRSLMRTVLDDAVARSACASILIAAEYPIYGRYGYGPASESATWTVDVPTSFRRPPPAGAVTFVEPTELRKLGPDLFAELRRRRPGNIARDDIDWDNVTALDPMPWRKAWEGNCVTYTEGSGRVSGYLTYHLDGTFDGRRPKGTLHVDDLVAATPEASAALWRYCCEIDWVRTVRATDRPTDEVLPQLLLDGRHAQQTQRDDFLWLRVLDPVAVLNGRRYAGSGRVVLQVVDEDGYANGRFEADPDGCRRSTRSPDLALPVATLGALALGGPSARCMADAGWLDEERPGAAERADALLHWPLAPWCATWF